jgi:hypothetical protein
MFVMERTKEQTIPGGQIGQMLKPFPHHGDAWFTITFAALEPAQLRNPADLVVQTGWLARQGDRAMDVTIVPPQSSSGKMWVKIRHPRRAIHYPHLYRWLCKAMDKSQIETPYLPAANGSATHQRGRNGVSLLQVDNRRMGNG